MKKKSEKKEFPILVHGEKYIREDKHPKKGFGDKNYPRTFKQAQELLIPQLEGLIENVKRIPEKNRVNEIVFTTELLPDFLAKSYFPHDLFSKSSVKFVGSRAINVPVTPERKKKRKLQGCDEENARVLFLSGTDESISEILAKIKKPQTKIIEENFRRLNSFRLQPITEKILGITKDFEGLAEVVLHGLHLNQRNAQEYKFLELCEALGISCDRDRIRSYPNGPIFCPVNGNAKNIQLLSHYNPLRVIRPMPEIPELQQLRGFKASCPRLPSNPLRPSIKIGMFDGGVDLNHPAFANIVEQKDLTTENVQQEAIKHGTAVASALAYGPLNINAKELPNPRVLIESFRVFPVPQIGNDGELNYVIDQIESEVPRNNIKFYNISFGPQKPIEDCEIDRFTYALDRLAQKYKAVFFIAVGNDGDLTAPLNRIQPAADMVNGIGVGALTRQLNATSNSFEYTRAPYSCVGPGRQGARIKPDISAFGGTIEHPFLVLDNGNYHSLAATCGTSFACPTVTGLAGDIYNSQEKNLKPLTIRALLLHTAKKIKNSDTNAIGLGVAPDTVDDVLYCEQNKVTIIYQDFIHYNQYKRLPILLPKTPLLGGTIKINWTLAYIPKIHPNTPDEYTLEQLDLVFRPNDDIYNFSPPKGLRDKTEKVNIRTNSDIVNNLKNKGFTMSNLPSSKAYKKFSTEQDQRFLGKWGNTILQASGNTRYENLNNPCITLHVDERYNGKTVKKQDKIKYACVITIECKKKVDLYAEIRKEFRNLSQVKIREQIRI